MQSSTSSRYPLRRQKSASSNPSPKVSFSPVNNVCSSSFLTNRISPLTIVDELTVQKSIIKSPTFSPLIKPSNIVNESSFNNHAAKPPLPLHHNRISFHEQIVCDQLNFFVILEKR